MAIETSNRPQLAREFTNSIGVTFPVVIDDQDASGNVFGVQATPTNLMIDPAGRVIFKNVGYAPGKEESLEAQIVYLLQKNAPPAKARPS